MKKILVAGLLPVLLLSGCFSESKSSAVSGGDSTGRESQGRVFFIKPGPNATQEMVEAMVQLKPKDILRFDCGFFDLTQGIQIAQTEDVVIEGCGKDKTLLSFAKSQGQEGFLASNVMQVRVQNLTIADSPGDAFKMKSVNHGQLLNVRAIWSSGRLTPEERLITASNWEKEIQVACTDTARVNPASALPGDDTTSVDYTVSQQSGRYGIYPVESRNILVDNVESIGASDAGIYVGQTTIAKIRNSRAAFNVFGFEIENVEDGEYFNNLAECNTGGFLVYDLDGLTRYGYRSRVYKNVARNNNTYNFAVPGSIVASVPRGAGLITLAYDKIDIYDNVFEDNDTVGILLTSYDLLGKPGDRRIDYYSEGVNIFNNTFKNNGNMLPNPDVAAIVATQGGQVTTAFPMLVGLKNAAGGDRFGYSGGHILWDGYQDTLNTSCEYPTQSDGTAVPMRGDGRPKQSNSYPNPSCIYNKYKFKSTGERKVPEWWFSCINTNNVFSDDSRRYANFHGTRGLDLLLNANPSDPTSVLNAEAIQHAVTGIPEFPATYNMGDHDCFKRFGSDLPRLTDFEFEPYVPSGKIPPASSAEETQRLCSAALQSGLVNENAYTVNCPDLASYNLFSDAKNPMSKPNGRGMPYVLNTKLFSDYSLKHRVLFIPTGEKATFLGDEKNQINAVINFPVGTIIAKTFTFVNGSVETPYETRLLIKRKRSDGVGYWEALEYIWDNAAGKATLTQRGGSAPASWNYIDVDTSETIVGNTDAYLFPNANQCSICHSNTDVEAGSAPIGPKPRNMNRVFESESPVASSSYAHPVVGQNQLAYMCNSGLMTGCPSNLTTNSRGALTSVEYIPKFNKPGDSGAAANSDEDIEARARAYLEVNCAHCHNLNGQASNTGFYVDVFRPVNGTFGICKKPTASGSEGRGGRLYDIHPGSADFSILSYRIGPEAKVAAAKMPPLARSVVHTQGVAVINEWITQVVDGNYDNADACTETPSSGGSGGFDIPVLGDLLNSLIP